MLVNPGSGVTPFKHRHTTYSNVDSYILRIALFASSMRRHCAPQSCPHVDKGLKQSILDEERFLKNEYTPFQGKVHPVKTHTYIAIYYKTNKLILKKQKDVS